MKPLPRVAIVHDWLTTMGGAEPMVLELHKIFPEAPIYTSVYDAENMTAFAECDVRTTYLQKLLPRFIRYKHVLWPVMRAHAFRRLDLHEYDLIISSASAEAKAIKKRPDAAHVCYCHTPVRYYWSHYDEFKNEFNFGPLTPLIRPLIPFFVGWMRKLDLQSIRGVDYFIANSSITQERIEQYYNRESTVIFPPVETGRFRPGSDQARRGYIVWGRHVPYKRFDLAIKACNQLAVPLIVVGSGPDTERLKKLAGPTITFTGRVSDSELEGLAQRSDAFLFPNEEDFGLAAVEAQSAGLPVIAYAKGGALDIVSDGKTGVLFTDQTTEGLAAAMQRARDISFDRMVISKSAQRFNVDTFTNHMISFLEEKLVSFNAHVDRQK